MNNGAIDLDTRQLDKDQQQQQQQQKQSIENKSKSNIDEKLNKVINPSSSELNTLKSTVITRSQLPKLDLCLAVKHIQSNGNTDSIVINNNKIMSQAPESNSFGYPRLSALRPSTLLPLSSLTPATTIITSPKSSTPITAPGCLSGAVTPCFWPSELQNLSPILTPSTWKLLKKLNTVVNQQQQQNLYQQQQQQQQQLHQQQQTLTFSNSTNPIPNKSSILVTPTFGSFYPTFIQPQTNDNNNLNEAIDNNNNNNSSCSSSTTTTSSVAMTKLTSVPVLKVETLKSVGSSNAIVNSLDGIQIQTKVKLDEK